MAILEVCPNPECGGDIMVPRRIGAHVRCEECEVEWVVEDIDPLELVAADDGLGTWDEGELADDLDELDELAGVGTSGAAGTAAPTARVAAQSQWECSECGMVYDGVRPPRKCPACGASGDNFNLVAEMAAFGDLDAADEDEL